MYISNKEENWKKVVVTPDTPISDVIEIVDKGGIRIAIVADESGCLLGTVTDGDIRRALIKQVKLDSLVVDIMNTAPRYASINDDKDTVLELMEGGSYAQIPLVDRDKKIIAVETLQNILQPKRYENPVFLMAGGFGKRLRPLTDDLPKPMLKVGSRPILETIIEQFIHNGFYRFYISTHYKPEIIKEYFSTGESLGVEIKYIDETKPLGTAGALSLLPRSEINLPIIVMNGDLLTKVNFENLLHFHSNNSGVATLCVREYDFQVPYGVVEAKGEYISSIVEKPVHKFFLNAGIYVIEPEVIERVESNTPVDMPNLLTEFINRGEKVLMFPIHEYWLDIGQKNDFEKAQVDFESMISND